jgi:putative transposase
MYIWHAVDSEGEVLEILVQTQRNKAAALRLIQKLLRRQAFVPAVIVTDKLRSYGAALRTDASTVSDRSTNSWSDATAAAV